MEIKKIIDLTYPIRQGMISFDAPWHPLVEITQLGYYSSEGRETRKISLGSHTGTHVDSPAHFIERGNTIDKIPLDYFIGPVTFLDFSDLKENQEITFDLIKDKSFSERIIFKFGWGKYWGVSDFYKNYPFFSPDAAQYLIDQGVKLIGLDTPSPDDSHIKLSNGTIGTDIDSPIHKIFLSHNIILVEYLANLNTINDYRGWIINVMPLKIAESDGSPARVCVFK